MIAPATKGNHMPDTREISLRVPLVSSAMVYDSARQVTFAFDIDAS